MTFPDLCAYKPIAPLTTLGVGGAAHQFCVVSEMAMLPKAIQWAREASLPVYVLGGGSNLLISDDGVSGCVIQIANKGIECVSETDDAVVLRVAAGENWDGFVTYAVTHNFAGIECLSGIPGNVGAAPIQNIGAYGQEVSVITEVETIDIHSQAIESFSKRNAALLTETVF